MNRGFQILHMSPHLYFQKMNQPVIPHLTHLNHKVFSTHPMTTNSQDGSRRPKSFPDYKLFSSAKHPVMVLNYVVSYSIELSLTPLQYSQAMKSSEWR